MRHLVSGGSGFLGSALCNKLVKQDHNIIAFDNFSRKSHKSSLDEDVCIFNGDVRNIDNLNTCIEKHKPIDILWHLAYINGTKTFYSDPDLVLDVGVRGALNTIDMALKHNIKNYILVSTSEVYNEPTQMPTPEDERIIIPDIYNPRFSYSGGKIISELLTIHYAARKGINAKILRPHNIYGPNMGFEHVIPEIISKILKPINPAYIDGKLVINIQGTGQETRSFCYIDDAIDQMIFHSNNISKDCSTYNIGVENEITISNIIYMIATILEKEITIISGNKQVGSALRRCPSMKKTISAGYMPNSNLLNGLAKTVKWYKEHIDG